MAKAVWKGTIIAESSACIVVEGVYYFPPEAVDHQYLRESPTHTTCHWKGVANYYHVVVDGEVNEDAAWYYPYPKPAARNVKAYVAFWKGIEIEDTNSSVEWHHATIQSHGNGRPSSASH